jgi:hypothetical protein
MVQIHRKFNNDQVKDLLRRYLENKIERKYLQEILGIKKRRFFQLVKEFKNDPEGFSICYSRNKPTRKISKDLEKNIIKELRMEKSLIENPNTPVKHYNYSYIKDILEQDYRQKVSLPTIIDRARRNNCYFPRAKRKVHDREVLTNYPGQLIQHDSSHHQFSPYAASKWYLITSLDDFSRFILYAILVAKESSWEHILALEYVLLNYGVPLCYYVDSHSVFRFVQGRDSYWRNHYLLTDQVNPQWKQVLDDCKIKVSYALSPQAKGKIERPYRWIQDRLVRACVREGITDIRLAQLILNKLIHQYNYHWIHSTTKEVPYMRFQRAIKENKTLFRTFSITPPFLSSKDIFCLRAERMVNAYHKISINNLEFKVPNAPIHERIQLRIIPEKESGISEVRFWYKDRFLGTQIVKNCDLNVVHF